MSALDHVYPVTSNKEPAPDTRGETITIYDFYGRVIETVGVTVKGDFQTSLHGIISRDDFGAYVLKISGHPAAPR